MSEIQGRDSGPLLEMRTWFREGSPGRPWAASFQTLPCSLCLHHTSFLAGLQLAKFNFAPAPLHLPFPLLGTSFPHPQPPPPRYPHHLLLHFIWLLLNVTSSESLPDLKNPTSHTVFPTSIPCFRFNTTCDHSFCFVYSFVDRLPQAPWRQEFCLIPGICI